MHTALCFSFKLVHCRTGSLEIIHLAALAQLHVHCRTGSLEITGLAVTDYPAVHCRTGSLEITVLMSM
tara:strand:- start:12137 stop:12340 length:204 start_codon:yes stop_codon:yes gene_type:complete